MSGAPIQFRTVVNEGERTLQWRHRFCDDAMRPGDSPHGRLWSDWEDVPEIDFGALRKIDAEELRLERIRQAQAIFGLTPRVTGCP